MYIQHQIPLTGLDDDMLSFLRAISVDMIHVDLRTREGAVAADLQDGADHTETFERAREQVEAHGMRLNNLFMSCWDAITLGHADMDAKIEAWRRLLESIGRAGIGNLGWNFKPMGNFRTTSDKGRGGVSYSTFCREEFDRGRPAADDPPVSEDAMWERMTAFLAGVLPAAEKAGVRMALHPDDPPVPEPLGGVAQICSTMPQFRRIFDMGPPETHGMVFCQGCVAELLGDGVYDAIEEMAAAGRIAWVHFRNVRGQLPRFTEVFIDEGDTDMKRAMVAYRDNGFTGPYMMDHTPRFPQSRAGVAGIAYRWLHTRAHPGRVRVVQTPTRGAGRRRAPLPIPPGGLPSRMSRACRDATHRDIVGPRPDAILRETTAHATRDLAGSWPRGRVPHHVDQPDRQPRSRLRRRPAG